MQHKCNSTFHVAFMAAPKTIKNKDGTIGYKIAVNFTTDGKIHRESRTFSKKQLAIDWANKSKKELEYESMHGIANKFLIADVLQNYLNQFAHNYGRSKNYDIARLLKYPIAGITVDKLTTQHIIRHCQERNKTAKPQTVLNDVIWLKTTIRTMSSVNGFTFALS